MKLSNLKTLTQVSLGYAILWVIILIIIITSFVNLGEITQITNRISDLRSPTVNASSGLKSDINKVLADLRGWMLLNDNRSILQRKEAWKSIREYQRQLQELSEQWTNPENRERLLKINELLEKFEASQDKTELLAWSVDNLPATKVLLNEAIPRAEVVFEQISKIMDSEKYSKVTAKRKLLFANMADFRGSFAIGLADLKAFLINADPIFIERFDLSWETNTASYNNILKNRKLLDSNQKKYLSTLIKSRKLFTALPHKIFEIRKKDNWNLANYELKHVAAPLGEELHSLLSAMALNQNKLLVVDSSDGKNILSGFVTELWLVTALSIIITILVAIYMRRNVDIPLNMAIEEAIELSENVASGKYLFEEPALGSGSGSSYETTLLLGSLNRMTVSVREQATQLVRARESAEIATQEIVNAQEQLKAQKDAMDQHSLVSITDAGGYITYVNEKFCEVSGYDSDELLGQNHRLLNSDNQPEDYWKEMYVKVMEDGAWSDQVRNKAKDGHFYWVDTTIVALYDDNFNVVGYTSIRTDITESKEQSIQLEKMQEQLRSQKEAMDQHSLVSITDAGGYITYVNEKFCEVSGYNNDELMGQNHRLLNSDNQTKDYWKEMYLKVEKEGVWNDQVRNKAKDGHFYWVDTTIVALYDDNFNVIGYTSIRTDITESVEQADELKKSQIAAEAATSAKTQFLATMSHEIRTPMNGVIGMVELLEDTPLNDEQKDYIDTISRSGNSLLSIINDILDFSKLDADMTVLESIPFDLEQVCLECLELISGNASSNEIEFVFDYEPSCPRLFLGDPTRIRQVILNLLGNAFKFTHEGFIRLGIFMSSDTENKQVQIDVQDSGIGLEAEAQKNLFSEFTQADSTTTRKYGGTGLGLSISHKIVSLMGGDIKVNSVYGEGTTFSIVSPLEQAPDPKPIKEISLKGVSVLFVDDHEFNQRTFKKLLEHMEVSVTMLTDPSQTLLELSKAQIIGKPYKVAIVADNLSDNSGLEIGVEIRKDTSLDDTKLLVFSSRGQKGDAANYQQAGFDAYLNKFSRYQTLRTMLSTMLNHKTDQPIITQRSIDELQNTDPSEDIVFSGNVLLVEDVPVNQIIAESLLISIGLNVDIANNGKEAVEANDNKDYDLIFMDCRMPVMDGYEATKNIRKNEDSNDKKPIPIIALTANASNDDRLLCERAGMDAVITKPFKRLDLKNCLVDYLPYESESV